MEPSVSPLQLPRQQTATSDRKNFINRELSSLAFNERIVEEAADPSVPLLERLKFLAIASANLDEFFMIRVAGLRQQLSVHVEESGPDALSPTEQLQAISLRTHELVRRQEEIFLQQVAPGLEKVGLRLLKPAQLGPEGAARIAATFAAEVLPVLTPLALDPGHPFPHLRNKSLNLVIRFAQGADARLRYGVVPVPTVLPRLMPVAEGVAVLLEDVIAQHVAQLFPSMPIQGCWAFRVTRNWDLSIDEEEAEDLLVTIEREVRRRDRGNAVRLQIDAAADEKVAGFLAQSLQLTEPDVYRLLRPLALQELVPLVLARAGQKGLHDEPFTPVPSVPPEELLPVVRERDLLLHHPYESFEAVTGMIEAAADDPDVLAIKIVLYRTGRDSPIVRALQRAAENGKQVTALVELKARMDEEANILRARELEKAGVQVVYGLIGYKTHCKIALVVRRENGKPRRYVHLGTGNYNPGTARAYEDLSFFTAREEFGADATSLFNLLTGYSKPESWSRFLVSPLGLKAALLNLIAEEARSGEQGRIVAKMNALADPEVIQALYRASQAGAAIDLLVRGICCLRPGVEGLSETVRVVSVVDRFLEHARIWSFQAGGAKKVYLASGDWMDRNFSRRVDVAFPVEDPALKERITGEILATMLGDNQKAWALRADGRYERVRPGTHGTGTSPLRSQEQFIALARRGTIADASQPVPAENLLGPRRARKKR